jgi:predicted thioesterase
MAGVVATTTMIAITAAAAHAQITRTLDPGMQLYRIVMVT